MRVDHTGSSKAGALAETSPDTFVEVLRRRAESTPEGIACRYRDPGADPQQLTYAEADAVATSIAWALREAGLESGSRCLLLFPPGLDYVTAFFGCLYAGVVAVPVYPPLTPGQVDHVAAVVGDAEPEAVLAPSWLRDPVDRVTQRGSHRVVVIETDRLPGGASGAGGEAVSVTGDMIAFLQYTSGSTGTPKGVIVTHENLVANSDFIADRFGHSTRSRGLIWLPPYHDMGLIGGVLQPIYIGFEVTLTSPLAFLRDPAWWLRLVSETRATTSGGPDFAYEVCVRKVDDATLAGLDLSSWEVAFTGAERVRTETLRAFAERFAPAGFRPEAFFPCYGLAESTLMVCGTRRGAGYRSRVVDTEELARGAVAPPRDGAPTGEVVSVGTPAPGADVRIVDPRTGLACPDGSVGEIWTAGPSVCAGYWGSGRPAEAFGQLSDGPLGRPYLRTGDLGFCVAGELFPTGRLKDVLIVRGRNFAPEDVELVAARAHDLARPGRTVAFTAGRGGHGALADSAEEGALVVAQEVRRDPGPDDAVRVAASVRAAVAEDFGLAVDVVHLLAPGALPRTSSGKLRRSLSRDALASGEVPVWHTLGADLRPVTVGGG